MATTSVADPMRIKGVCIPYASEIKPEMNAKDEYIFFCLKC